MSGTVWLCESVWMCRSMSLRLSLSVCLSVCVSLWLCAPKGECGSVRVYMCLCVFACVCVLLSGCGCGCLSVCLSGDVYYTRKTKSKAMRRSQVQIHILDNSNFILGYLMKVRSELRDFVKFSAILLSSSWTKSAQFLGFTGKPSDDKRPWLSPSQWLRTILSTTKLISKSPL